MKFQKLTIHNIASIEDAVIDFEAQPLSNSEVFLITGKTGAGKSTILDAICLALYADTPRLDNTKMQGETNDAGRDVKINDPRQLMRRNTGEAFAMLTFVGNNGVHYEATWSVVRARKKVTGKLQDKEWHLRNIDADYTLVKKVEIEAEIKMAVGLDFSQFCRTTMLAQGEFTRFLNSKDDEKAEILEKITGVDIYSRIGAKIFEVTSQKKQDWEQSQQRVEGIRVLAESEIAERQEALNVLETETKHINSLKEKETAKLEWIKADNEFNKAVSDAKIALERAVDTIEKEEFKQQDALVRDWNETIDARGWLTEIIRSSEITAQQSKLLEELKRRYVEVLNGQRCEELKKNGIEEELKAIENYLEFEKVRIPAYENSQKILGLLRVV
ncbi:MAG: AAA family ATPase, partial [Bacteroidaceae bacterium]|nr:AAA family ATPase [Bacteroidaceae bacterium]